MITDRMGLLHDVADAVAAAMRTVTDWGPSGARIGQYALDVTADDAALAVLRTPGSVCCRRRADSIPALGRGGRHRPDRRIDECQSWLPWFATSLCFVDDDGPAVALVVNQATGVRFSAERGAGAWCGERRLQPSTCESLSDAIVVITATPPPDVGWAQFRALGACALDLCAVADGLFDGYVDFGDESHGVWDYLGGLLICREAGSKSSTPSIARWFTSTSPPDARRLRARRRN
jgi:hypothetical protein